MKNSIIKYILFLLLFVNVLLAIGQSEEKQLPDSLAILLIENNQSDLNRVNALSDVINTLFKLRDYESAKPYINEIFELSDELNNNYVKALGNYYKGSVLFTENHFEDAITYLLRAKNLTSILRKTDDNLRLQIRIYSSLSVCYFKIQKFKEYYENVQRGLDLNKELKHSDLEFSLQSNLAVVYLQLGKDSAAIEIDKKLISDSSFKTQNLFYPYFHLGEFNLKLKNYDTSFMYFDKAFEFVTLKEDAAWILFKKGYINNIKENFSEAIYYLTRCIDTLPQKYTGEVVAGGYIELGYSYYKINNIDTGIYFINKGIEKAHSLQYLDVEVDGLKRKTDILYELGSFKEFAQQILKYNYLKDSLNAIKNIHQLTELVFQQKIKEEEEQLRYNQYKMEAKYRQNMFLSYIVLVLLVSAIIVILLLLNRKNILIKNRKIQQELLSNELDLRNREMTAKVLSQIQKKELLSDIIEKLTNMEVNTKSSKNIRSIIIELKQSLNDNSSEDFDYYFVQTHPDFYNNLLKDFPGLTPYELRLCAYLKMNLSTKDIATIGNISPDSARTARSRLRKTLNINNQDENLVNFLSKY